MKRKCKRFKQTRAGRRCASYSDAEREYINTRDAAESIKESILDSLYAVEDALKDPSLSRPHKMVLKETKKSLLRAQKFWKRQDYFGALAYLKDAIKMRAGYVVLTPPSMRKR